MSKRAKTTVHRSYKYRIYPTAKQVVLLEEQLAFACDLYNAALEQRRDAWKRGRSVTLYDQMRELTALRASLPYPEKMPCTLQRDPLRRLDRAFGAFFRRCKAGENPGYPRFRSRSRYDSLTWVANDGARLRDGQLRLAGIGAISGRWHRVIPNEAIVKEITAKRANGRWYAYFSLELPLPEPTSATNESIGIDLGISTFARLSSGEPIEGPRANRKVERDLRISQRRVCRRKRGSRRRRKAADILARKHEHVRNVRRNHAFQTANQLVARFSLVAVEGLNIRGLARSRLARDVSDQGWGQFICILRDKAEWAGSEVVLVDPRGTSQDCSECGQRVPKALRERMHCCPCGYIADRDVNAARNILQRGLGRSLQAPTVGEEVRAVA